MTNTYIKQAGNILTSREKISVIYSVLTGNGSPLAGLEAKIVAGLTRRSQLKT